MDQKVGRSPQNKIVGSHFNNFWVTCSWVFDRDIGIWTINRFHQKYLWKFKEGSFVLS